MKELIGKYGRETFQRTVIDLMDYSEARMRAEIRAFPDGCYRFEDGLEDDGIEDKEYTIRCAVHVQGDEVVIDYTGSSTQAWARSTPPSASPGRPPTTRCCTSPTRRSRRIPGASAPFG